MGKKYSIFETTIIDIQVSGDKYLINCDPDLPAKNIFLKKSLQQLHNKLECNKTMKLTLEHHSSKVFIIDINDPSVITEDMSFSFIINLNADYPDISANYRCFLSKKRWFLINRNILIDTTKIYRVTYQKYHVSKFYEVLSIEFIGNSYKNII